MSLTCRTIGTSPDQVFGVLADGWTYASWVVGAAHMRDVDDDWPAVGSCLHHRVGPWPLTIDDRTRVVAMEPDRMLELDARAFPLGSARVVLRLEPVDSGSATRVWMEESLSSPMARTIPLALQSVLLNPRNNESLARLDDLAVRRGPR